MIGANDVEGVSLQNNISFLLIGGRLVTHYGIKVTLLLPKTLPPASVACRKQLGLALFLRFPLTRQFSRPTNHSVDN